MLRIVKQNITSLKYPVYASLSLSFASLGDAFMYAFLPQHAGEWNIPAVWVGILLSINRFIRIVFNWFVPVLFFKYGVRHLTIIASILALMSTMGYGLGGNLVLLLLFRILWGIAFAILRIGAAAHAFEYERVGVSLGISKSIQELGPLLALWIGPILLTQVSGEAAFFCLTMLSLPALLYACKLPQLVPGELLVQVRRFKFPSPVNAMTFFVSFITEGVLIISLGHILLTHHTELTTWSVTTLAAAFLSYRRICIVALSPIGGVIADKVGFNRIFNISVLAIVIGLVFIMVGWEILGLAIVFAFNSINSVVAPGSVSVNETRKLHAVSINATWRDMGAATGSLAGGFFYSGNLLSLVLLISIFILFGQLCVNFIRLKTN